MYKFDMMPEHIPCNQFNAFICNSKVKSTGNGTLMFWHFLRVTKKALYNTYLFEKKQSF